jgi:hypothetical protein
MESNLAHRVGRPLAGLTLLTALALAACKSTTSPAAATPTGSYKGTVVGSIHSGVLNVTFASAGASAVTGTYVITAGSSVPLTGTYGAGSNPQISVTGGGYTITGTYAGASDQFSGSSTGPAGDNGQWAVSGDAATVKVFCGTYAGSATGTWNVVLDKGGHLSGATSGGDQLVGTYTSGSSPNTAITFSGGSASGNLNPTTGAGSGTWVKGSASGTWTANTSGC